MEKKTLLITHSASEPSQTLGAVKELLPSVNPEIVDLSALTINHYNYDHEKNKSDDFQSIIEKMSQADVIIFATPVYWYAMSGRMKVFFDRLAELLSTYKPIGKGLKGKETWLVAQGWAKEMPEGFEVPFKETSNYFGMIYKGALYKSQSPNK